MKTMRLLLAGLTLSVAITAVAEPAAPTTPAAPPRLALWITDSIGTTDASLCDLVTLPAVAPSLPTTPPTLTERDVSAWHPQQGRWSLDPARYVGYAAAQKLQDHCFVLAIDGKFVSSGVALSSYSERLTGFTTLIITTRDDALDLQMLSSNHGRYMRLIHVEAIDAVLGQRPN